MKLHYTLIATLLLSLNTCYLSRAAIVELYELYNPTTKCTVKLIGELHSITNTEHTSAVEEFCQHLAKKSSDTLMLLELGANAYTLLKENPTAKNYWSASTPIDIIARWALKGIQNPKENVAHQNNVMIIPRDRRPLFRNWVGLLSSGTKSHVIDLHSWIQSALETPIGHMRLSKEHIQQGLDTLKIEKNNLENFLHNCPSLKKSQLYDLMSRAHNAYSQFTAESMPKFIQSIVKYIHQQPLSQEIIRERLINLRHWQCIFDVDILRNILHNQTQIDSIVVCSGANHTIVIAEALTHCGYNIISHHGESSFTKKHCQVSSEAVRNFFNLPANKSTQTTPTPHENEEAFLFNALQDIYKRHAKGQCSFGKNAALTLIGALCIQKTIEDYTLFSAMQESFKKHAKAK